MITNYFINHLPLIYHLLKQTQTHPPNIFVNPLGTLYCTFAHAIKHLFIQILQSPEALPSAAQSPHHLESSCLVSLMPYYDTHTLKRKTEEKLFSFQKSLLHRSIVLLSKRGVSSPGLQAGGFLFQPGLMAAPHENHGSAPARAGKEECKRHSLSSFPASVTASLLPAQTDCRGDAGLPAHSGSEGHQPQTGADGGFQIFTKLWNLFLN